MAALRLSSDGAVFPVSVGGRVVLVWRYLGGTEGFRGRAVSPVSVSRVGLVWK